MRGSETLLCRGGSFAHGKLIAAQIIHPGAHLLGRCAWHLFPTTFRVARGPATLSEPDVSAVIRANTGFGGPRDGDRPAHDLKIQLQLPLQASLRLVGPSGERLDGRTTIALLSYGLAGETADIDLRKVPKILIKALALNIDHDGTLALNCLPPRLRCSIEINAPGLGKQVAHVPNLASKNAQEIHLRQAGTLSGRVVAGDSKAIGGLPVFVTSLPGTADLADGDAVNVTGRATAVTDDAGRFAIEAVAVGSARVSVQPREELGWLSQDAVVATVKAGATTADVKIELKRGMAVHGRVVEEASGKPVADVTIALSGQNLVSDANGEVRGFALPGQLMYRILKIPPPWVASLANGGFERISDVNGVHELQPIKLTRGQPLEGAAVDENGMPVDGARLRSLDAEKW